MKFGLLEFLTLIGAVGLFLYGMKLMSEGLQKAAGDKLRNILALMTNNRFVGAFTGIFITALVQSSSATTVMIVSFVNAGSVQNPMVWMRELLYSSNQLLNSISRRMRKNKS